MSPPSNVRKRDTSSPTTSQKKIKHPVSQNENDTPDQNRIYYIKTHATGGYCGNEYEIKLSGLIWLNLKYDDDVKDFLLATNLAAACPLDDICLKITWKDEKRKPTIIFIQAKHKINDKNPTIELDKMFSAYEKIKKIMNEEKDEGLFENKFEEFECYPILYTNEDFTMKTDLVTDNYCPKLNDIIGTRGSVRKLSDKGKEQKIYKMGEKIKDKEKFNAFVNCLLIFSRQASEIGVEEILEEYIDKHPRAYKNPFPLEPHPVTMTFIRMFTNWWKEAKKPFYLTKKDDLLEDAFKAIIKSPWMSSLNIIFKSKINNSYEFTDDAVSSLNLRDQHSCTVITTENSVLTVIKVLQHLDKKDHVVIDLKRIASLQHGDRKALCEELKTKEDNVLILVCDNIPKNKTFKDIGDVVKNKKCILISNNNKSSENLKEYFPLGEGEEHREILDEKIRLTDMSKESQETFLETATVKFQDKEIKLTDIIDDESKVYVKGDVLNNMISEQTVAVGKQIFKRNYEEIKHLYIDRRVKITEKKQTDVFMETSDDELEEAVQTIKSFLDIPDDIVLLTAEPGMGKSTLLTHLSIRTKALKPEVWIVRVNLLEYSEEFSKWKKDKTTIHLLDTLKFMCMLILRDKLGKENKIEFTLEETDNVVFLKTCAADPIVEFELNLFLHFYCERQIIFLIDGFDEICPHYTEVVIKFLKTLCNDHRKHRMWITSRSYNQIKTILEKEFELELSYELHEFSEDEMEKYLQIFWESNLKLEELNDAQLENVKKLIEHVLSVSTDDQLALPDGSLYGLIQNAAFYLSYKVKNTHIPLWKYNKNYHQYIYLNTPYRNKHECDCCACCYCTGSCRKCNGLLYRLPSIGLNCDANPLFLYLAAVDVEQNIKQNDKNIEEILQFLDVDTYTVYEKFLEHKIRRRYQEKNGINIYTPDIITAFDRELADSILKHKELGAYAIFGNGLFSEKELEEIKEMIKVVEKGEEKTGLIDSVADGIPIFIHRTFAEFFAVEYISDCLKTENICEDTVLKCFHVMLSEPNSEWHGNARSIFNQKIKIDKTLMSALEMNKDVIWEWIKFYSRGLICFSEQQDLHNLEAFLYGIVAREYKQEIDDNVMPKNHSD